MKAVHHDEKIGIALTDEEMLLTIKALGTSRALLRLINNMAFTPTGVNSEFIKWFTELEEDYRKIYENYKENKSLPTIPEDCENCD